MSKIKNIELNKLRNRRIRPDKAVELANEASKRLAAFKTRFTAIHDELTALNSVMGASSVFTQPQKDEVASNLSEIIIVKEAISVLEL